MLEAPKNEDRPVGESGDQTKSEPPKTFRDKLHVRIRDDFRSHNVSFDGQQRMEQLRDWCLKLAQLIVDTVPEGREQASALTRLEEVMFHANAGISRKG